MFVQCKIRQRRWRLFPMLAAIALAAAVVPDAARAGDCPADKVKAGAMEPGARVNAKATDTVLASIDLAKHYQGLDGRLLRLRYLEVQPGGEIAWHSHGDRPALIYILEGSIIEYRSDCSVPIEHKAGEVAPEAGKLSHWWKNNGTRAARLLSADLARAD